MAAAQCSPAPLESASGNAFTSSAIHLLASQSSEPQPAILSGSESDRAHPLSAHSSASLSSPESVPAADQHHAQPFVTHGSASLSSSDSMSSASQNEAQPPVAQSSAAHSSVALSISTLSSPNLGSYLGHEEPNDEYMEDRCTVEPDHKRSDDSHVLLELQSGARPYDQQHLPGSNNSSGYPHNISRAAYR